MFTLVYSSLCAAALSLAAAEGFAAEPGGSASPKEPTTQTDVDWIDDRWSRTDLGQFLHATIETPGGRVPKGIAMKVGERDEATVLYDTDALRCAAGWTGGFLRLHPQRYGLIAAPAPAGQIQFSTRPGPGWANNGGFADPRERGLGRLPKDWAHYKGLFLSGKRVVLKYTVGDLVVLESPWLEQVEGKPVFTRNLEIQGRGELIARICESNNAHVSLESNGGAVESFQTSEGERAVRIASDGACRVRIAIGGKVSKPLEALEPLTRGGPARWNTPLETRGVMGKSSGPFQIDTLTMPYANPWNALMFASGHDFLPNGDALVSTIHGDVWRVSGLDRDLRNLSWERFATGLYQPLGLKVRDGQIYVLERDQITRLRDLNGDGEADHYENFNNDCISAGGGHSYATSLETDSQGNFYFTKCAEDTPHGGSLLRVSADGSKLERIATGFRNPNGLGIGPNDIITVADQQGEWVPETRLDVIEPGGFYGYMPMHKRAAAPTGFDDPLCWIPRALDNSAGGQAWVPEDAWGRLGGQMLHLSFGRCTFMLVLRDGANGGIVPLPGRFLSGAMRGRFHDGDFYVTGLRGWQTAAIRDGCFQRVRRTEVPLHSPVAFDVRPEGLELTFDTPLDEELAADPASFAAEQWNYRWTQRYGSPDYSVRTPDREGRDPLEVVSAARTGENKVRLRFRETLRPVNVLRVSYSVESADGEEIRGDFYATLNEL